MKQFCAHLFGVITGLAPVIHVFLIVAWSRMTKE